MNPEFPFKFDDFLASIVEALKHQGDARAMTCVVAGDAQAKIWDSDFGVNAWRIFVTVPVEIFYAMSSEDRQETENSIQEAASEFFRATPHDALEGISLAPRVEQASFDWREEALRFIRGEGVTNQGRVRSDNIASKHHQGLLFRSKQEITLFQALTRARLAVAPLPVFVRVGKSYNRLEPDFVVIYKGLTFVVEVDGDTYHKELPAEADKRLVPLTYEGVEVRRIRAAELQTDAEADAVVKELIDFMASRKASR